MRTEFIFHSGLDTIGAVILEIRYGNDRIFLEAGTAYNPSFDMFDGNVSKRKNFISDYLWVNELPFIDGIYRKQDITKYNLMPVEENKFNQAFFITHLHLDHMRMMGMIAPNVKVYLTKQAETIEKALEEVDLGVDSIRENYEDIPDEVNIGNIKVKKFILNKDSYQDLSFYIETPDLKMHYTGDVFAYGVYKENLYKEIAYLNEKKPDILFCEGTQFWSNVEVKKLNIKPSLEENENMMTKEEFDEYNIDLIKNYNGLVVLNYYEREISDVIDYLDYADKTNRTLVFEPRSAHIINKFMNKKVDIMIPDTEAFDGLKEIIEYNNIITKDEVLKNPNKYIIQNTYPHILELLDYRNLKVMYLHHSGTPLGDFDPKMKKLKAIIEKFKFDYVEAKVNGKKIFHPHATREQLLAYINMVNASLLIPCHSANRKAYVANVECPYFMCEEKKKYYYDKENNTLKEAE